MHETTSLHFDLSHLARDQEFTLHVGLKRYTLTPHTRHTLTQARRNNKAIALLPDERVTHFAGTVQLPAKAIVLLRVTASKLQKEEPLNRLVLTSIRIPQRYRAASLARRQHCTSQRVSSKLKAYGLTDPLLPPDKDIIIDVDDFQTSHDAAYSLVFHHPELLTLQLDPANIIIPYIQTARGIGDLADSILEEATNHEKDPSQPNWVTSQPSVNYQTGKPDASIYVWSDKTLEYLKLPVQDTIQQTKNDLTLENQCWTVQPGIVQVPMTPVAPDPATSQTKLQDDEVYYDVKQLTPQYGVENQCSYDPSTLTATVSLTNYKLRWLQITADQYAANDTLIHSDKLGYLSPPDTIMAVPLPSSPSGYSFTFVEHSAYAILKMGGIGQAPFDTDRDIGGISWTSVFNFGIPTLFIALGVSADILGEEWKELTQKVVSNLSTFSEVVAEGPLGDAVTQSVGLTDILAMIGNLCTSMLTDAIAGSAALSGYITALLGASAAEDAAPFVGWIARAIGSAADVASLIETSVAVANSPATMELEIIRIMDLQVTVNPDPRHQEQWPATATHYQITVTLADGTARTYDGQMSSTTQEGPIIHTFNGLPSGGNLTVLACFYSDTGWLAGQGKTDPIGAAPNQGNTLVVSPFAITENLVPLTSTTTYSMKEKLGYGSQGRSWLPAQNTSPPTATVSNLDGSNTGNNLQALVSLGLNESKSALSYSWVASGQNIPLNNSGNPPYSGQMCAYQCISDGQLPESGLKLCSNGYIAQICLALPPSTMPNPVAEGFLLEPDAESGDMYLRALSLDAGQPMIVSPGNSFGHFTGPQDHLAIHPAGYAVALSQSTCKLQIVKLGAITPDAQAPIAPILAGWGQRPGLLDTPIALACSLDRILVLQITQDVPQGCVVAFDIKGNPVYGFANNQWSMNLHPEGLASVVPVDISVEAKGYIYVLKYLQPLSGSVTVSDYLLDIYNPDGSFLTQVAGIAAARMQVDLWRNLFTLNYEILLGSSRTEPTVAQWIPSTPNVSTSALS